MKKTTKVKKSKVKTLFSPTAITQHLVTRVNRVVESERSDEFVYDADEIPGGTALRTRLRDLNRQLDRLITSHRRNAEARNRRLRALADKTIDKIVLGQVPASMEVVADFYRRAKALR